MNSLRGLDVLLVVNDLRMGGAERQSLLLARELRRMGISAGIVGFASPGPLMERCEEEGVPCEFYPISYPFSRYYALWYCVRLLGWLWRLRPRTIIAYTSVPQAYLGTVWRFSPVRACIWNQRTIGLDRMLRPLEFLAARWSSCFVSNSSQGAEFLRETLGIPADRVHVIHNGIEIPETIKRDIVRRELGLNTEDRVACMVANVRKYKDHGALLDAWERVVDRWTNSGRPILLLVGRVNPEGQQYVDRVQSGPLREYVRFLGYRSDVSRILGACDLGVFSSHTEALPNGVLECMAAGLAVVATDLPGIRECVGEGYEQGLFQAGDAEQMANACLALLLDDSVRATLAARLRGRVEDHFSLTRMVDSTYSLLKPYIGYPPEDTHS